MGDATRAAAEVPGGIWLVARAGSVPQFTGADFTDDDRLYAKTAEDFVRNEVLPRLEEIESKAGQRSEEHTSELQSRPHLVCRLLLEKKKERVVEEPPSHCTHPRLVR